MCPHSFLSLLQTPPLSSKYIRKLAKHVFCNSFFGGFWLVVLGLKNGGVIVYDVLLVHAIKKTIR